MAFVVGNVDDSAFGIILPPFSGITSLVSDSESVLASSDMLVVEKHSLGVHSCDDLELSALSDTRLSGIEAVFVGGD